MESRCRVRVNYTYSDVRHDCDIQSCTQLLKVQLHPGLGSKACIKIDQRKYDVTGIIYSNYSSVSKVK